MTPPSAKSLLIILDGFGIGKDSPYNAIKNARMPFYQMLQSKYPFAQLLTHGPAVGLPEGVMGNSEVGHMTLGSGRVIYQDLVRIHHSIADKSFFKNPVLKKTLLAAAEKKRRVHFLGLLSDAGVHSHLSHLLALLDLCLELQIPNVSVHPILDGRDTPPQSSPGFLKMLLSHPIFKKKDAAGKPIACIATLSGRYFAMDRDQRWDRVQKAYDALTGKIPAISLTPEEAIAKSHQNGKTDEFVEPLVLNANATIQNDDSVVFFNFRSDRAREMTEMLQKKGGVKLSAFAGMTLYDSNHPAPAAFSPQSTHQILGDLLEQQNLNQFRIAETEKYAHVTFFFNCGREAPFKGEERNLIPSPKEVATYDLKPEMSAFAVAEKAADQLNAGKFQFGLMNFANADMVGHTGKYDAAIRAMEALDQCLSKVIGAATKNDFHVLLTADHGNAEEMQDCNGEPHTQHTLNPVPLIWIAPGSALAPKTSRKALKDGTLADIAPTICELMNMKKPAEMTGKSLL